MLDEKRDDVKKTDERLRDAKLCTLFAAGYTNKDFQNTPISFFKGEFICVLLGNLAKYHNLGKAAVINVDSTGCYSYVDEQNHEHLFKLVNDGILILTMDGPNAGHKLHLTRQSKNVISNTVISEKDVIDNRRLSHVVYGMAQ